MCGFHNGLEWGDEGRIDNKTMVTNSQYFGNYDCILIHNMANLTVNSIL